jgi:outer membrane receptor protein involved in Fe transport
MSGSWKARLGLVCAGALMAGGTALPAAADGLEEIVVTAQRREQKLSDVSASVAAFDAGFVKEQKLRSLDDLSAFVPNFTYTKGGNVNIISIRGLGTAGLDTFQSSVGVYVDDIYIPKARNAAFPIYDLARIEVLRGPQGTLFGKNTIAGVLNVVTAKPSDRPGATAELNLGSYSYLEAQAAVTGPITPVVNARLAAFYRTRDGYIHNRSPNRSNGGGFNTRAVRLGLEAAPTDALELGAKLEWFDDRETGISRQLENVGPRDQAAFGGVEAVLDRQQVATQTGLFDMDSRNGPKAWVASLNGRYRLPGDYALTAVAGYTDFNQKITRTDSLPVNTITQANPTRFRNGSIDLRVASPDADRLRVTAGLYYDRGTLRGTSSGHSVLNFANTVGFAVRNALAARGVPLAALPGDAGIIAANTLLTPGNGTSEDSRSFAAYGELGYRLGEQWTLIAGLRYSNDRVENRVHIDPRDANGNAFASLAAWQAVLPPGSPLASTLASTYQGVYRSILLPAGTPDILNGRTRSSVTPSGRVEYRPLPDTLVYGIVQTGFKQGGFATGLLGATPFDDEKALAFELGAKTRLWDGRADLSAALFRTGFRDLQVQVVNPAGTVDTLNAAKAVSQGLELDGRVRLDPHWTLSGSYALLDAHYTAFPRAPCSIDQKVAAGSAVCFQDLGGRRLINAPRHSATISVGYSAELVPGYVFGGTVTGVYKSRYYSELTDSRQLRGSETGLINLRLSLAHPDSGWEGGVLVRNVAGQRGAVLRQTPSLVADPATWTAVLQEPRMVVVQLRKTF